MRDFERLYSTDKKQGAMFGVFVGIAIVIACMGLFGLAAFTAGRRTKEIGIRKVFGARIRDVVFLLLWQFSIPVLVANLIAWPVAWYYLHGWLQGFAYRIPLSPLYFLGAGAVALVIAWATCSAMPGAWPAPIPSTRCATSRSAMFRNYLITRCAISSATSSTASSTSPGWRWGSPAPSSSSCSCATSCLTTNGFPARENLYRVEADVPHARARPPLTVATIPFPMPARCRTQIPEVTAMTRLDHRTHDGDDRRPAISRKSTWWIPNFFQMIRLPLVAGDPAPCFASRNRGDFPKRGEQIFRRRRSDRQDAHHRTAAIAPIDTAMLSRTRCR